MNIGTILGMYVGIVIGILIGIPGAPVRSFRVWGFRVSYLNILFAKVRVQGVLRFGR